MLSVRGALVERIQALCRKGEKQHPFEVSCLNTLTDVVVTGLREDIASLRGMLQGNGLKCVVLDLPFAFHSQQMSPILDDFKNAARYVTFKAPTIPVVSPLLGQGHVIAGQYLARATRKPVNFVAALDAALSGDVVSDKTAWIDIGPHPVCTSFASTHYGRAATQTFASLRRADDARSSFTGSLAALYGLGLPVAWNDERPARLLHLDSYQWNYRNYWLQYEGSWTLDKAHAGQVSNNSNKLAPLSSFFTSSVQQIIFEEYGESIGQIKAISDLNHPDLRGAADGHKLNGRNVMTGSIWADVSLTVGEYMYKRMVPDSDVPHMDVQNMEVFGSQVLQQEASAQPIQIEAIMDMSQQQTAVGCTEQRLTALSTLNARRFALGESQQRRRSSEQLLTERRVSPLWERGGLRYAAPWNATHSLLDRHSGSICRHLPGQRPAWHLAHATTLDDSTFQSAGFVMNSFGVQGTDGKVAGSSRDFFYITPGWRHFRLLEPLESATYRNYVRMFPFAGEPGAYAGDIYLYRGEKLIGMCIAIKFKAVRRALMPVLFPRIETGQKRNQLAETSSTKGKIGEFQPQQPPAAVSQKSEKLTAPHQEASISQKTQSAAPVVVQQPDSARGRPDQRQNPKATACPKLIAEVRGRILRI
ncbi:MAG: hypothetical protein Q9226_002796 [Calogaya cf. arnoldii]